MGKLFSDEYSDIISVKEARKLLGKEFAEATDDEIRDYITKLYLIARGTIRDKSSI